MLLLSGVPPTSLSFAPARFPTHITLFTHLLNFISSLHVLTVLETLLAADLAFRRMGDTPPAHRAPLTSQS
jgi:hypothetical protein